MSRLTRLEMGIANLRGDFPPGAICYQNPEDAHRYLVTLTGVDFGLDASLWESWLIANPECIPMQITNISDARRAARSLKPHKNNKERGT